MTYRATVSDFTIGQRVKSHPATDAFMRREVYGEVVKIGRKLIHVKMDYSGRTLRFTPNYVLPVS